MRDAPADAVPDDGAETAGHDFVVELTDVSSYRWSKARRLIGTLSLGLIGPKGVGDGDVERLLGELDAALEAAGYRPTRLAGSAGGHVVLLRGTEARLHRELYREQLDAWIQSRARGEFAPPEPPPASSFTPARRIALLHQPLLDLLPQLERTALRPDLLAVKSAFPLHDRRFCAQLLSHLCRRPFLQANLLHALRNGARAPSPASARPYRPLPSPYRPPPPSAFLFRRRPP